MGVLGILVAIVSSIAVGALLEQVLVGLDAGDKHDAISKAKESEAEELGSEKSAEASVAKEEAVEECELVVDEQSGAPALLNNVKEIVDTKGIADAVIDKLQGKGISIPKTAKTTALTEAAVEAMVEELAKRLSGSLELLVGVHIGKMTREELEEKHPRTASAMNSVSESFKKRGLVSDSSVQDVVNTVVNNASGISGMEQRAIAGSNVGAAPATNAATPVVGAANTNVAAAGTGASGEKVVVEAVGKASEAGVEASSGRSGVTIEDVPDEAPVKNADAEVINTGDDGTRPYTSVADPTLTGGGDVVPHSADGTVACFEAPVTITGVNLVSL